MTVVFARPYQFVPPLRSEVWPWLIQRLRLCDRYLRKKEGVVDYQLRGIEHVAASIEAGHSTLWAPNHCRYADPLTMCWPARQLGIHVHAMASWHLFNEGWFDSFAIRRMGGFSVFREGSDRQALEAAIEILVEGRRPLIIFPEGTTNRTNDRLKPLLDGVAFIARTAARRRAKRHREPGTLSGGSGEVVVQPVAIKYLCVEPIERWAHAQLDDFERRLGWKLMPAGEVRERTVRLAEAQLALKEVQYLGGSQSGNLPQRRDALIEHLLTRTEQALGLKRPSDDVRERVRQLRAVASARYFENHPDPQLETELRQHVQAADLAQDLLAYPDQYLEAGQATDTRVVETIQRMQETILGKADHSIPLKAVVEFAPAIPVTTKRPPRGERDPLMQQLEERLTEMIAGLATEARPL